ncbi:MAG: polyprenyl synthetase family protein [Actinomycetota bacterium]|nr:polyprenyl synthetase family protein [Actinomycetota bacterium]
MKQPSSKPGVTVPPPSLDEIRVKVDEALDICLQTFRGRFLPTSSVWLVDEIGRVVRSGGRRIRPLLCCLGYAAVGGEGGPEDGRIIKAAASLELLHTFALVHDDVMDDGSKRRGQATTHRRAAEERKSGGYPDAERYGISVAVLTGNLALVISDTLIAESGFDPAAILSAATPLGNMRMDAVAGQYLDLKHSGAASADEEIAATIGRLKTSSYSISGPLQIGATLGGGTDRAKQTLGDFAEPLGDAFQLADDLIGLLGDPDRTGKDSENDLRQGRPTSLIVRAMGLAAGEDRETIKRVWGNPESSEDDVAALRDAVARSGAPASITASIRQLVSEAKMALAGGAKHDLQEPPCRVLEKMADQVSESASRSWPRDRAWGDLR